MTVINRYEVIVGKINGFHTREEMETEKMVLWTQWRTERVEQMKKVALTHIHYYHV